MGRVEIVLKKKENNLLSRTTLVVESLNTEGKPAMEGSRPFQKTLSERQLKKQLVRAKKVFFQMGSSLPRGESKFK